MRHAAVARQVVGILMALVLCTFLQQSWAIHDTSTGTYPEVQAMRTVDAQSVSISGFEIITQTSAQRYAEIAAILNAELASSLSVTLTISALDEQDDNVSQIVLGDTSSATIVSLAGSYHRSTLDLGEEGYNLIWWYTECVPVPA